MMPMKNARRIPKKTLHSLPFRLIGSKSRRRFTQEMFLSLFTAIMYGYEEDDEDVEIGIPELTPPEFRITWEEIKNHPRFVTYYIAKGCSGRRCFSVFQGKKKSSFSDSDSSFSGRTD